jgi:hypothetical protein
MEFLKHIYASLLKLDKKTLIILGVVLLALLIGAVFIPQLWLLIAGILGLSSTESNKERITKIVKTHQKQEEVIQEIKEEGEKQELAAKDTAEKEAVDWLDGDFK